MIVSSITYYSILICEGITLSLTDVSIPQDAVLDVLHPQHIQNLFFSIFYKPRNVRHTRMQRSASACSSASAAMRSQRLRARRSGR